MSANIEGQRVLWNTTQQDLTNAQTLKSVTHEGVTYVLYQHDETVGLGWKYLAKAIAWLVGGIFPKLHEYKEGKDTKCDWIRFDGGDTVSLMSATELNLLTPGDYYNIYNEINLCGSVEDLNKIAHYSEVHNYEPVEYRNILNTLLEKGFYTSLLEFKNSEWIAYVLNNYYIKNKNEDVLLVIMDLLDQHEQGPEIFSQFGQLLKTAIYREKDILFFPGNEENFPQGSLEFVNKLCLNFRDTKNEESVAIAYNHLISNPEKRRPVVLRLLTTHNNGDKKTKENIRPLIKAIFALDTQWLVNETQPKFQLFSIQNLIQLKLIHDCEPEITARLFNEGFTADPAQFDGDVCKGFFDDLQGKVNGMIHIWDQLTKDVQNAIPLTREHVIKRDWERHSFKFCNHTFDQALSLEEKQAELKGMIIGEFQEWGLLNTFNSLDDNNIEYFIKTMIVALFYAPYQKEANLGDQNFWKTLLIDALPTKEYELFRLKEENRFFFPENIQHTFFEGNIVTKRFDPQTHYSKLKQEFKAGFIDEEALTLTYDVLVETRKNENFGQKYSTETFLNFKNAKTGPWNVADDYTQEDNDELINALKAIESERIKRDEETGAILNQRELIFKYSN